VLTAFAADRLLQSPLVSGGALFWGGRAEGEEEVSIWRQSFDAGEPTRLGRVNIEQVDAGSLALSSAGVIVTDRNSPALMMPLDGGTPRPLAHPEGTEGIGVGPGGAYWRGPSILSRRCAAR
jgi:hypothetical protein